MTAARMARATAARVSRWLLGAVARIHGRRRFNGMTMGLPAAAAEHILPFMNHPYERLEWDAAMACVHEGDVVIDVGANIGVLTVAMARRVGARGKVLAVEPQPAVYAMLVDVLARNGCDMVIPVQAALLDRCGVVDLQLSEATPLGVGSSAVMTNGGGRTVRVPALTLDSLAARDAVAYVKIDAEGAEVDILAGASRLLAEHKPIVQVEVHGHYMQDHRTFIERLFVLMAGSGYTALNLSTLAPTTAAEFAANTRYQVRDPGSGEDLSGRGYGHVLFIPTERQNEIVGRLNGGDRHHTGESR